MDAKGKYRLRGEGKRQERRKAKAVVGNLVFEMEGVCQKCLGKDHCIPEKCFLYRAIERGRKYMN